MDFIMNQQADPATGVGQDVLRRSDDELLGAMAQREQQALAELYDRYATVLYTLALKIVGNASTAQDVVQEAFLTAWRKAALYSQKRGNVRTWLIVLCRNLAIDHYRAKMRLASRRVEMESVGEILIEHDQSPAEAAVAREDGRLLQQALEQLPREQRDVIELAYFRGLSQSEIAEETNTPLGTVKTRTRQAMMKLRGYLVQAGSIAY
ncbi:sigma-70 family RNA polymerase sigma factor [candidate division KSB1 bacterium]|nr:MAG: sigma-70 family RNA polymerase sigma factor [candidate division KSB1 bacterium]MBC6951718.1 RNA polymerase subunit sigma-70 [candidate division KSB1 bacterium]MCE7944182.1 sigma-70 family RNA polymerase sigma factor [Chlorobi bacterium CHB1]MDL1878781.1 sigma-70 family RNA polymerase sigma factor [Cytophagia bacterium CHB2]